MLRSLGGWLGRKTLVYVLLFAAILAAPPVWRWIAHEWSSGELRADTMSAAQTAAAVRGELRVNRAKLGAEETRIRAMGREQLAEELTRSRRARNAAAERLDECDGWLDKFRPSRIVGCKRSEIEIAFLDKKIAALNSAKKADTARRIADRIGKMKLSVVPAAAEIAVAVSACDVGKSKLERFRQRWKLDRWVRNLRDEETKLARTADRACAKRDSLRKHQRNAQEFNAVLKSKYAEARRAADRARSWPTGTIADIAAGIDRRTMGDALRLAAFALVGIILAPFLIRTLLYWVVTPLAERRGVIRLAVLGGRGGPIPSSPRSSPSIGITLREGEELLVRQGYFQTRSLAASPRFRLLLSWRHPLSSFASGMTGLTTIRGTGQETTVSATRDPLAEVTLLELPDGASCVVQPRALAAVAQPIRRPLRITGHWRLLSLNAWLTGQLRYLVFHGPARLVIKGLRGVRVERAAQGRVFGQDQLVGFSADLAYSVTRTETFAPYLAGREPLLKDKVEAGDGVLIVEEAPLAGGGRASRQRGLEGAIDAVLKLFGI